MIIVVIAEGLGLALLQILQVELVVLVVLDLELLVLRELCPVEDVSELNVAHGLQLHSLHVEVCDARLERGRDAEDIINLHELELDVEVVRTFF